MTRFHYKIAKIETTALLDLPNYKLLLEEQGAQGFRLAFAPMMIPGSPAALVGGKQEPNMMLHYFIKEETDH